MPTAPLQEPELLTAIKQVLYFLPAEDRREVTAREQSLVRRLSDTLGYGSCDDVLQFRGLLKVALRLEEPAPPAWMKPGAQWFNEWRERDGVLQTVARVEGGCVHFTDGYSRVFGVCVGLVEAREAMGSDVHQIAEGDTARCGLIGPYKVSAVTEDVTCKRCASVIEHIKWKWDNAQ